MRYFLFAAAAACLDSFTKQWAQYRLPLGSRKRIGKTNLFFWHIKNDGAAYHSFAGKRNLLLAVTGSLLAGYAIQLVQLSKQTHTALQATSLALLLGGGLGNFQERLLKGHVTDFLYVKKGSNAPIFNIADLFVALGAALYVCSCAFVKHE